MINGWRCSILSSDGREFHDFARMIAWSIWCLIDGLATSNTVGSTVESVPQFGACMSRLGAVDRPLGGQGAVDARLFLEVERVNSIPTSRLGGIISQTQYCSESMARHKITINLPPG